ncbi:MAG: PQQ-binding-like beta-propeller repeat protein [Planctomycetia bacterium]|nr:PQQ-binding-like beta-propeller repeat protein [Planctomycetia bacterium]
MRLAVPVFTLCGLLLAGSASTVRSATPADGWPTFRGAERTAVAPDTGLLTAWPEAGPALVWESAGAGRGYASLAIAGGRIYTMGDGPSTAEDKDEYLLCFNLANGQQLWKTKTGEAWNEGDPSWQGSRSTPTVDANRIYVLTAHGVLICANDRGDEVWRKDLKAEFGGDKADGWGYSEAVLIDGHKLVCTPGAEANTMVALDKLTGDVIWSCSRPEDRGAGHASIVISEIGGTRVYVQTTGSGAMGVRAEDGKLLWTYDIDQTTAVIPTPIVRGDLVFFAAGYGRGGALLRQVGDVDGAVTVEEIYGLNKELANKHGGIVLVGDYLYGDSDDKGIPFCAELMTGSIVWKSRGTGRNSASVVAADGHIYVRYADGTMTLVQASPAAFKEVGSFKVPGSGQRPSWAHPVIFDGRLYLREDDKLMCFELKP